MKGSRNLLSFRSFLLVGLTFLLIASVVLAVLWEKGWIQGVLKRWVQQRIIQEYVDQLQPHLPFKIEKVDFDVSWEDVKNIRIPSLVLVLSRDEWKVFLYGPLTVERRPEAGTLLVRYVPTAQVDREGKPAATLFLSLWADFRKDFSGWSEIGAEARGSSLSQLVPGLSLEEFSLQTHWENEEFTFETRAGTLVWQDSLSIDQPSLALKGSLKLEPFTPPSSLQVAFRGQNLEALSGDIYVDLPLRKLPIDLDLRIAPGAKQPRISGAKITLPGLHLETEFGYQGTALLPSRVQYAWNAKALPVTEIVEKLSSVDTFQMLKGMKFYSGSLSGSGEGARLLASQETGRLPETPRDSGEIELRDLTVRDHQGSWAVRNLGMKASFALDEGVNDATISAEEIHFKRFKGRLKPMKFSVSKEGQAVIPQGIPLQIDGLPLKIGSLRSHGSGEKWRLLGSLELAEISIERLARGFCATGLVAPATIAARFPKAEISTDSVDLLGGIKIDLFGGSVEIDELGLYDISSGVPELNFNARWDGILLDRLGGWLNYGKMDGIISGYAKDVVFQSWLPTQFEVLFRMKPLSKSQIVFSPDAMRNTLRIFTGETLDNLPGVVKWANFGWPSQIFGGYDITYAGFKLSSYEGSIVLETLDSPEALKNDQNHYILYGPRVRIIPIQNSKYPYVMDLTSLSNYARSLSERFSALDLQSKEREEKPDEATVACTVPEF